MVQIEKEHAGSGLDKPAPKTLGEKISEKLKTRFKPANKTVKPLDIATSSDESGDDREDRTREVGD